MRARLSRSELALVATLLVLALAWVFWLLGPDWAAGAKKKTPVAVPVVKVKPAGPTNSSPIAMSVDQKLVWSVNPADDSVSVIRTDRNTVVKKIKVGDEPEASRSTRPAATPTWRTRRARA
jgi:YVTN family beta-propeller protein